MSDEAWDQWSPLSAPHVIGRYTRRVWDAELRQHEPQKIEMTCQICKAEHRAECPSGRVRDHIARFGSLHLHRDPLA